MDENTTLSAVLVQSPKLLEARHFTLIPGEAVASNAPDSG
jgi:hypothetical protein